MYGLRDSLFGFPLRDKCSIETLSVDPTQIYIPQVNYDPGMCMHVSSLSTLGSLFSTTVFATPEFCEAVMDCMGQAMEDFFYNDTANKFEVTIGAHFSSSNTLLTVTGTGKATDPFVVTAGTGFCATVINCVQSAPSLTLNSVTTSSLVTGNLTATTANITNLATTNLATTNATVTNLNITGPFTLPSGTDLFTLNGQLIESGSAHNYVLFSMANTMSLLFNGVSVGSGSLINLFTGSWAGPVYTYSVNGVTHAVDYSGLASLGVFASNDDQVLIADASSVMDLTFTPTVTTDPDSQVDRTDYTVSSTIKPTYISSGNPVSPTNKIVTEDSMTADNISYGPGSVKDALDDLLANSHVPAVVAVTSNPALSSVLATQEFKLDLTTPGSFNPGSTGLPTNIEGALLALYSLMSANDEVQPYTSLGAFPATGTAGILYIDTGTGATYTWNGSSYVSSSNKEVYMYTDVNAFPATGIVDRVYIAKNTWLSYAWDVVSGSYKVLDRDVLRYNSISNFPSPGDADKLYVDETADKVLKWDPATATYIEVSGNDDVLPYPALANFPAVGEVGKIYIDLATDRVYAWDSTTGTYIQSGSFTVNDTATVNMTKIGNDITADVIVSPNSCNQLSALTNGLYVAPNTVFETATASWNTDLAAIPGGTYLKNNDNGDFVYKKCDGTIVIIVDNMLLGAENGLYVALNNKVREGGALIENTQISLSGFYKQYLAQNGKSIWLYPDANMEIGRSMYINQGPTADNSGILDIGSKDPANDGGTRTVWYSDANGSLTGRALQSSRWSYPRNSAGVVQRYSLDEATYYDITTFEKFNIISNSEDGNYLFGPSGSGGSLPKLSTGQYDEKVLLIDESDNFIRRSSAPLDRDFLITSSPTTPPSFIQLTNASFSSSIGGYDYYSVNSQISLPNAPYTAPAGYRWMLDVDYSEQMVNVGAINNSFSYVYFENVGISIREAKLEDVIVGDSITFPSARKLIYANNTGNSLKVTRFLRIKSGLTLYATGGYTEFQYNSATVKYVLEKDM